MNYFVNVLGTSKFVPKGVHFQTAQLIHQQFRKDHPNFASISYQTFCSFKPHFLERGDLQECISFDALFFFLLVE